MWLMTGNVFVFNTEWFLTNISICINNTNMYVVSMHTSHSVRTLLSLRKRSPCFRTINRGSQKTLRNISRSATRTKMTLKDDGGSRVGLLGDFFKLVLPSNNSNVRKTLFHRFSGIILKVDCYIIIMRQFIQWYIPIQIKKNTFRGLLIRVLVNCAWTCTSYFFYTFWADLCIDQIDHFAHSGVTML